jgi:hypothetical protein
VTPVRGRRGKYIHLVAFGVRQDQAPESISLTLCGVRLHTSIIEPDAVVTCWRCEEMQHEIDTFN